MHHIPETVQLHNFVNKNTGVGIFSTGAKVINFTGSLYNVSGSSGDPKQVPGHKGNSWKQLLIDKAGLKNAECYVTNVPPPKGEGKSHPEGWLGGHMTENKNNEVIDGICQLMPLCSWHNSTKRNSKEYTMENRKMLELSGYVGGETAATFLSRSGPVISSEPFKLVYFNTSSNTWEHRSLSKKQALNIPSYSSTLNSSLDSPFHYILIERSGSDDTEYFIQEAHLPPE